ncbi:MAG: DNA primase catalytic subunit PriS [Candidatus Marsarchaeota archaeon]|jgi:DNA primase small subunit|nr:DNA primase catalytic subunit PriS [Candidatus Marsarchaeota archaeon]
MLDNKTILLVKEYIKYYYKNNKIEIKDIDKREFGFGDFENKISFRHYAFKNDNLLKNYFINNAPPFVSYSSAEYEFPDARPMDNKKWLGAELIFDLDADDLHLACQKEHGNLWVCENCLSSVKNETIRLIEEFLIPDFGFSESEIKINFSGNRGYHVHVLNKEVFKLGSEARRNISNYISGIGININAFFPTIDQRGVVLRGPKPTNGGWGGKLASSMIKRLNNGENSLLELGIEKSEARMLIKNKTDIIFGISIGNWDKVRIPKKSEFWKKVIKNLSIKQSDSIDKNVTNDIHHLIRVPNTIHGDSGLVAKEILSLNALEKFDPMKDAIAFKDGTLKVYVIKSNKFYMNDNEFEPFNNVYKELPTYAALYLVLKRVAKLV